jgi:hypothetical protein
MQPLGDIGRAGDTKEGKRKEEGTEEERTRKYRTFLIIQ